jgi:hypothetical protein
MDAFYMELFLSFFGRPVAQLEGHFLGEFKSWQDFEKKK